MNNIKVQCARCQDLSENILAMTCSHHLCFPCAEKLITKTQKVKGKIHISSIICQICSIKSPIKPQSVQILLYSQQKKQIEQRNSMCKKQGFKEYPWQKQANNEQEILFCFNCLSKCFSIEQYLNGMHKDHDVRHVKKSYTLLQQSFQSNIFLLVTHQKVTKTIQSLNHNKCKITQCKRDQIEKMGSCKLTLFQTFTKLKKIIQLKENQVLRSLQVKLQKNIEKLDRQLQQINQKTAQLQIIEDDIKSQLAIHAPNIKQLIKSFNYYSLKHFQILENIKLKQFPLVNQFQLNLSQINNFIKSAQEIQIKLIDLQGLQKYDKFDMHYFEKAKQNIFNNNYQGVQSNSNQYKLPTRNVSLIGKGKKIIGIGKDILHGEQWQMGMRESQSYGKLKGKLQRLQRRIYNKQEDVNKENFDRKLQNLQKLIN